MILTADSVELANHFGLDAPPEVSPRYNIAVVALKGENRGLAFLKWGLVPYRFNDGTGHINARDGHGAGLPAFADSFRTCRRITLRAVEESLRAT